MVTQRYLQFYLLLLWISLISCECVKQSELKVKKKCIVRVTLIEPNQIRVSKHFTKALLISKRLGLSFGLKPILSNKVITRKGTRKNPACPFHGLSQEGPKDLFCEPRVISILYTLNME